MVKKSVRAQIGLLRDDWFLPVQEAALDQALVYVGPGHGLHWKVAARKALEETYAEFNIEGIDALINQAQEAIEAAEEAA